MSVLVWSGATALVIGAALLCLPQPITDRKASSNGRVSFSEAVRAVRRRRAETPAQQRKEAAEMLRQFSALLQSGRGQGQAWQDLLAHWRRRDAQHPLTLICAQAVAAESSGLGTAEGLRRAAARTSLPEVNQLVNRLIAVTALSEQTGAALSHLVEQLASSVDDSAQLAADVETAVAGPKLTQLILTLLPAGAVLLGHTMGAAPVYVLLGGGLGMLSLIGGIGFLALGRMWSARMISTVMRHV